MSVLHGHEYHKPPISCSHILHFTQVYVLAVQSGPKAHKVNVSQTTHSGILCHFYVVPTGT
jgi:hypothetical protein